MVLVRARIYCSIPKCGTTDLIGVAMPFNHQYVIWNKTCSRNFCFARLNHLDHAKVERTSMHICNSKVGNADWEPISARSDLKPSLHLGQLSHHGH